MEHTHDGNRENERHKWASLQTHTETHVMEIRRINNTGKVHTYTHTHTPFPKTGFKRLDFRLNNPAGKLYTAVP